MLGNTLGVMSGALVLLHTLVVLGNTMDGSAHRGILWGIF